MIAGMSAFLIPIVTTELDIRQDAYEYTSWREQFGIYAKEAPQSDTDEAQTLRTQSVNAVPAATPEPRLFKTGVDVAAAQAANADFIGWLQIPGTTIDYPVVQTDDTDYYLNHTFAGKKSYIGTLFSLGKTDFRKPSQNIAIYGHHIRSNDQIMFSPLLRYKDPSFYTGHEKIYLDTLHHSGSYKIFAALNMRSGDWEPSTADFKEASAFIEFVNRAKTKALYDTGVEVQASDRILTLITCDRSYGGKDGRLIVMAVEQP